MTQPTVGISITKLQNEPRAVLTSDMSVVGIVGTAPDADAGTFPLNTPVLMFSDDATMLSELGDDGTLVDALASIGLQLGELQNAVKVVVIRVTEGMTDDATITNILGSQSAKTGLWALAEAGHLVKVQPRLICVPGYTAQTKVGLATPVIAAAGTGGTDGTFNLAFTGGTGSGAAGTFTVAGGKVTGVALTNPGVYSVAPTISLTASSGLTGASVTVATQQLANPVCAALPAVLNRFLGVAFVSGPIDTLQNYSNWRGTLSSDRLIPLALGVKVGVDAVVQDAAPFICAMQAATDFENEGVPVKVAGNRPVYGIVGASRPVNFSLTDGATEGQALLAADGGIIVAGEAGVETAIADGGYIYLGATTTSEDSDWKFYNVVRMRDYIHLAMLRTLRFYLLRFNIVGQTLQAIYNTMEKWLAFLQSKSWIIGFKLSIPVDANTAEQLAAGAITLLFQAEEPPPLMTINIQSTKYLKAFDAMIQGIQSQLDQVVSS